MSFCDSILETLSQNPIRNENNNSKMNIHPISNSASDLDSVIGQLITIQSNFKLEKSSFLLKISELEKEVSLLNRQILALESLNKELLHKNKLLEKHNNEEGISFFQNKASIAIIKTKNDQEDESKEERNNDQIGRVVFQQIKKISQNQKNKLNNKNESTFSNFEIDEILQNLEDFKAKSFFLNFKNENNLSILQKESNNLVFSQKIDQVSLHFDVIRDFRLIETMKEKVIFSVSDDCQFIRYSSKTLNIDGKNDETEFENAYKKSLSKEDENLNSCQKLENIQKVLEKSYNKNKSEILRVREHLGPIFALDYNSSTNQLATGGTEGIVRLFNVEDFSTKSSQSSSSNKQEKVRLVKEMKITDENIWSVQFNKCFQQILMTVSSDDQCKVFSIHSFEQEIDQKTSIQGNLSFGRFSDFNAKEIFLADSLSCKVHSFDLMKEDIFFKKQFDSEGIITCFDFDMSRNSMVFGSSKGELFFEDFRTNNSNIGVFNSDDCLSFVRFFDSNRILFGGSSPYLHLFDIRKMQVFFKIKVGSSKFGENLTNVQIGQVYRGIMVSASDGNIYSLTSELD